MTAKKSTGVGTLTGGLLRLLLTLSCLITAFWFSWHGLAQINFGYSLGYKMLHIDQHIQRYGPSNRYRDNFELTSYDQHQQLFSDIVSAIQQGGAGLAQITYTTPDQTTSTLLREAEVIHLQDVANLITLFNQTALGSLILLLILAGVYHSSIFAE